MAEEGKAPWIIDFETIDVHAFNCETTLEDVRKAGPEKLNKELLEVAVKYLNSILSITRRLARSIVKDKTINEDTKKEILKRIILCQDVAIRAIGKVQSLTILKGKEFTKQANSTIADCKEIATTASD